MDGEDANTLDGYLQMAILLYRNYSARMAFCLTFWGTSLRNILMKLLVAGCLRSKGKQRIAPHCHWLSMASMRCTSWRCGSVQQRGYFFHVAIHEFHWARGSEAQRAEAATRHQGRTKYRGLSSNILHTGNLSEITLTFHVHPR